MSSQVWTYLYLTFTAQDVPLPTTLPLYFTLYSTLMVTGPNTLARQDNRTGI